MAYREQGERPPVPASLRQWYTKSEDGAEKGPFELKALARAFRKGTIRPETLVRPEDESEWRRAADVKAIAKKRRPKLGRADYDPARDAAQVVYGSFGAGFAAGFFGGCIGWLLVQTLAHGEETKRGARIGFAAQCGVGLAMRLMVMAGQ